MSFKGIQAGDRVYFTTPQGQERSDKAQLLLIYADHVVVNCGGAHGTPAVVTDRNYVRHTGRKV